MKRLIDNLEKPKYTRKQMFGSLISFLKRNALKNYILNCKCLAIQALVFVLSNLFSINYNSLSKYKCRNYVCLSKYQYLRSFGLKSRYFTVTSIKLYNLYVLYIKVFLLSVKKNWTVKIAKFSTFEIHC